MSIATAIQNAQTKVENAYTAISNKGGTLPATQNLANMPTAIASIPSGGYTELPSYEVVNGVAQKISAIPSNAFSGITSVGDYAFYYGYAYNYSLTTLTLNNITVVSGYYGCNSMFYNCLNITGVDWRVLTTVSGTRGCNNTFGICTQLTTVNLSGLTTVSGDYGCAGMFTGCSALTNIDIGSLAVVSGRSGCQALFSGCSALATVVFTSLTTLSGKQAMENAFSGCKSLSSVSFPSLTTSSFGTNYTDQFNNLMYSTGTTTRHTLHFPSNMESTIQGLTGYPLFGGTSGYVILAFDLPPTDLPVLDGGGGTN